MRYAVLPVQCMMSAIFRMEQSVPAAMTTSAAVRQWALIARQVAVFAVLGPPLGGNLGFPMWFKFGAEGLLVVAIWSYLLIFPVVMAVMAGLATALLSGWIYRRRVLNPLIHVCIGGACGFASAFLGYFLLVQSRHDSGMSEINMEMLMIMGRCGFYGGCISAFAGWLVFFRPPRMN